MVSSEHPTAQVRLAATQHKPRISLRRVPAMVGTLAAGIGPRVFRIPLRH